MSPRDAGSGHLRASLLSEVLAVQTPVTASGMGTLVQELDLELLLDRVGKKNTKLLN